MEHISNFELYGNEGYTKSKPFKCFEKINIVLAVIFIIEIIYLICTCNFLNKKTYQFNELNYRKYELNSNNDKLSQELYQAKLKNNEYNEEILDKQHKIKTLEDYINNFNNMSKELLNSNFTDNELYIKTKEKNIKKRKNINNLKLLLKKSKKDFGGNFDSIILDSETEFNNIINLISNANMIEIKNKTKLCYRGENSNLNLTQAYDKCELYKNISFLMIFQNNIYKRYGAFISNNNAQSSFIFGIYNNGYVFGTNIEEISIERRQSLLYIINLIKKYKYDNEENSLDSNSIINDLEIFKI
jgi:hypothetical protein